MLSRAKQKYTYLDIDAVAVELVAVKCADGRQRLPLIGHVLQSDKY